MHIDIGTSFVDKLKGPIFANLSNLSVFLQTRNEFWFIDLISLVQ
jgi:hypothetical protein